MGSICSCFSVDDFEDYMNPNSLVYRNGACVSCFLQNILDVSKRECNHAVVKLKAVKLKAVRSILDSPNFKLYTSIFRRGQVHSIASSIQGAASMTSTASFDHSLSDMYRSPPRPLPYDADPRFFRSQHDGLVSRREKGSSHLNDDSEPLRGDVDVDQESLSSGDKWNQSTGEAGSKEYRSKSSLRLSSAKFATGAAVVYASSEEEEDVCPTCLEEYTEENPKILTKCSHHYHLGCIYEWMERSDSCPVCGKVMVFDETA